MIRVGLVGCGRMGEVHLNLIRQMPGVQIVGVADTDPGRANALGAKGRIDLVAGNLEDLLRLGRPDAVHILTPPATHASLACAALRAGSHVFVEKPMALTAQEASVMVAAADRGRLLTVGHNHLFDPIVKEARSRVTQGRLGQLIGLDVFHGALPGESAWVSELPSGPWMEDVPHLLYLSQLFMGDIVAIQAIGHPKSPGSKVTELRLVARHATGASSMTYSAGAVPFRIRLTLFGTERTVEVDLITGTMIESREFEGHRWLTKGMAAASIASQLLLGAGRNALGLLTGRVRSWPGLHILIEAFYEAIRTGGPSPVPATQGARATDLMEEIGRRLDGVSRGSNG